MVDADSEGLEILAENEAGQHQPGRMGVVHFGYSRREGCFGEEADQQEI